MSIGFRKKNKKKFFLQNLLTFFADSGIMENSGRWGRQRPARKKREGGILPLSLITLGSRFEKASYKGKQSADAESLPECQSNRPIKQTHDPVKQEHSNPRFKAENTERHRQHQNYHQTIFNHCIYFLPFSLYLHYSILWFSCQCFFSNFIPCSFLLNLRWLSRIAFKMMDSMSTSSIAVCDSTKSVLLVR